MSERDAQIELTSAFIAADPTEVVLVPTVETITASGTKLRTVGTPRDPQTFKLIPMTFDQRPTVTADGVERIIDYTLMGMPDAVAELWDTWSTDTGDYYLVVAITDGHGYEKKLLLERHLGRDGLGA
jgi:hypothetical protein